MEIGKVSWGVSSFCHVHFGSLVSLLRQMIEKKEERKKAEIKQKEK
jgi:hypothetical protein